MTTSISIPLTITFQVTEQTDLDDDASFEITCESVEPRGVFSAAGTEGKICGYCDPDSESRYCCDACAVKESISETGEQFWLEYAGAVVDRVGTLEIVGHNQWSSYSTAEGVEHDEDFTIASWRWLP